MTLAAAVPLDPAGQEARQARPAIYAVVALMLLAMIGLRFLSSEREALTGDGDGLRQLSYLLVFAWVIVALKYHRAPLRLLALPLSISVLLLWCVLSLLWAIEPAVALRRLTLTTIIVLTVFAVTDRAGAEVTIRAMRQALLITLLINYVAVLASPAAIHPPNEPDPALAGAWRGAMLHKNFTGAACAATILFYAFAKPPMVWWWRLGVILAAAVFLVFTKSKTSLVLTIAALTAGYLYCYVGPRMRRILAWLGMIAFACVPLFAGDLLLEFADSAMEPGAFTGRGSIWQPLLSYAASNPLFGAGFGSFWNIGPDSPIADIARDWVTELGNGHNGYLDLLVTIGAPGLAVATLALLFVPGSQLITATTIPRDAGALVLSLLVFCAAHNLTETSLLDRDAMVWVFQLFAVALTCSLVRGGAPRPAPEARR